MQIQGISGAEGYRPGACNIGAEEIASRRRGGLLGVGIALVIGLVLVAIGAPSWARLLVFVPLAGGLIEPGTSPPSLLRGLRDGRAAQLRSAGRSRSRH